MKTLSILLALSLVLGGCATRGAGYVPVVDMQNKDAYRYSQDLGECQNYAKQRADAATGAIAGALAGAILAAIIMPRGYRNEGASKLGLLGAAGGAGEATETQEVIIKRCLMGRGYSVLN